MAGRRVIAMSARGSVTAAVEAMRAGAADFLPKPVGAKMLIERLEAVMAATRAAPAERPAASPPPMAVAGGTDFAGFVGRSPAMRIVYERIARLGRSRAPVLVTGETGTGKEIAAEALHAEGGEEALRRRELRRDPHRARRERDFRPRPRRLHRRA